MGANVSGSRRTAAIFATLAFGFSICGAAQDAVRPQPHAATVFAMEIGQDSYLIGVGSRTATVSAGVFTERRLESIEQRVQAPFVVFHQDGKDFLISDTELVKTAFQEYASVDYSSARSAKAEATTKAHLQKVVEEARESGKATLLEE